MNSEKEAVTIAKPAVTIAKPAVTIAKPANLYVRLEPGPEEQAEGEGMLDQLGISVSDKVNIFLKQMVKNRWS